MRKQRNFRSLPDYHLHTALCRHADGEVADYRKFAKRQGLQEVCFTDHGPNPDGYNPTFRMELDQFSTYRRMVKSQQDVDAPIVLFGIEVDYYEGCEKFLLKWIPTQGFDLVLGSVHYIDGWGFHDAEYKHIWDAVDVAATWRKYFSLVDKLVNMRLCDAISHLDLPKTFRRRPSDRMLREMVQPVLDGISSAGMGIEINTRGLRKPVGEIYPSPLILSMAQEREIPICFGSDAHKPENVGSGFEAALELAREVGYTSYFRIEKRMKKNVSLPEI
jgi:histidinol-phosphatase (PHP family)